MDMVQGFRCEQRTEVEEIGGRALILRHEKTGARVLCLENDDENKVFGISLRTPPSDSTGVAHILEHSVLCGSQKYPVKEPFVELLKGSLQTFLNALTFPDKTCYPVASANQQDFMNLMDVYLDAVFFPDLTPMTLKQEGWHYEPGPDFEADRSLVYKGVVYNEMKGAYSSPDGLLAEASQNAIFPDTCYGLDSGGDPAVIPELTFAQFMEFHRRHYHPANSLTVLYGDFDRAEVLAKLAEYFERFEPAPEAVSSSDAVALQPAFAETVRVKKPYAVSEAQERGAMFTVNFGLGQTVDPDLNLRLHVLEHVLIGLPSSPLKKALLDSGLGEDLAGIGLEADLRQMYFSVGLKGMREQDIPEAEAVVERVLSDLADGMHPHDVEAAINTVEFDLRENNTGAYPRGLSLMFRALSTWLHGGDPLALLAYAGPLERLKKEVGDGKPVLEAMVREWFLENPHRAVVSLVPDPELAGRLAAEEHARLDAARDAMSEEELAAIPAEAEALRAAQERPDDPAQLARIPRLGVEDLPRRNRPIPIEVYVKGESRTFLHDLDTSSLVYLDIGFDLRGLPDRLMGYVPVFGRALLEMGTENQDYVSLQTRIARKTGGIAPRTFVSEKLGSDDSVAKLFLRGKATAERAEELVEILLEVLMLGRLGNRERFRQIVLEAKARFEQRIVPAGHGLVAARLRARMNEAGWIEEQLSGVTALFFLRDLVRRVDEDFDSVLADLEEIRSIIFSNQNLVINLTAGEDDFMRVNPGIAALTRALPETGAGVRAAPREVPALAQREGLIIPAQVNYVGKGVDLAGSGMEFTGGSEVVSRYLRTAYLWDKVRVQGGAYGAFSMFDRVGRTLGLVSYRDPNLDETVELFDRVGHYLRETALAHDDIEKSIVGAIGAMDEYLLPDAKGFVSMARALTGITPEWRQRMREQVLSTTSGDFRHFAEAAFLLAEQGHVVVLGGEGAIKGSGLGLTPTRVL